MIANFAQVEREAMTLPFEQRARLADKLWDSLSMKPGMGVVMSPNLERLLDEGLENPDQVKTTDELRRE